MSFAPNPYSMSTTTSTRGSADFRAQIAEIERDIFKHPHLMAHFTIVSVYLGLDSWLLEPISFLRQEGLWGEDMAKLHGPTVALPQPSQVDALRDAHASLFVHPPSDLFNLICKYRHYTDFQPTGIVERLAALRDGPAGERSNVGRTAPEGQVYACPSEKCKKTFRKGGHAKNHVQNNHPEYLQLHPDYQPQQFCVDVVSSAESTSPELERQALPRSRDRPLDHRRRQTRVHGPEFTTFTSDTRSTSFAEELDDLNAFSPRSYGMSSSGDTEESLTSAQQYRRSRKSENADRHAPAQACRTLGSPLQAKRVRDPYSSGESLMTERAYFEPSPQHIQRRQSKRLSMQYPHPQIWPSLPPQ